MAIQQWPNRFLEEMQTPMWVGGVSFPYFIMDLAIVRSIMTDGWPLKPPKLMRDSALDASPYQERVVKFAEELAHQVVYQAPGMPEDTQANLPWLVDIAERIHQTSEPLTIPQARGVFNTLMWSPHGRRVPILAGVREMRLMPLPLWLDLYRIWYSERGEDSALEPAVEWLANRLGYGPIEPTEYVIRPNGTGIRPKWREQPWTPTG